MKTTDLKSALSIVDSGQRVFVHGGAATPTLLLQELLSQRERFRNVELIHLHTLGDAAYAEPEYKEHFRVTNLFVGRNIRKHVGQSNIDYLPCFLSEIPILFRSRTLPLDVALIQVSPPDKHGYCSLGVSVDVALAAVQNAKTVIAQINRNMPRVHGEGFISTRQIDFAVEADTALPEEEPHVQTPEENKIGQLVSTFVDNGSTLQMGIGAVPNAILSCLRDRKHLGIHTETWSDSTLDLIEAGAVDNSRKAIVPGKTVSSFLIGSRRLYDFVDDNPSVVQLDSAFVNRPEVIAANPKVIAINSAVEVDLTGQVCADSIGARIISGVGGQMDFIRGAAQSAGGKAIIAITSRTKKGISRLVPALRQGAGVVTTRAHVHFIVTEYGVAEVWGKPLRERAKALIEIAHPEDRAALETAWGNLCN
jgi:4-hydroxybutyrate CoA-transferase